MHRAATRIRFPPARQTGPPASRPGYGPEDFPGCESFHLTAVEIDRYEGRLEFWEARTETALEGP